VHTLALQDITIFEVPTLKIISTSFPHVERAKKIDDIGGKRGTVNSKEAM